MNHDLNKFKTHLRDFLIQLKEFSGTDNAELFAEDREQEQQQLKAAERERALKVGGLLKPAELQDQDDELWLEVELRNEFGDRGGRRMINGKEENDDEYDVGLGWEIDSLFNNN